MAQNPSTLHYRIYLLTIWEERSGNPDAPGQWRFSLEHPATGQRQGFASLAALTAALQRVTGGEEDLASKERADSP